MKAIDVANKYYAAFEAKSDFSEVPMADGLVFRGPMMTLDSAAAFRQALGGMMGQFRGLTQSAQFADEKKVVTVYEFDLGLPGGPLPMAEVLHVRDGEIAEVDLIFDSVKLMPPSS